MSNQIQINMIFDHQTKGAVRYTEVDEDGNLLTVGNGAKVGTLYIRKDALGGVHPMAIQVIINGGS